MVFSNRSIIGCARPFELDGIGQASTTLESGSCRGATNHRCTHSTALQATDHRRREGGKSLRGSRTSEGRGGGHRRTSAVGASDLLFFGYLAADEVGAVRAVDGQARFVDLIQVVVQGDLAVVGLEDE